MNPDVYLEFYDAGSGFPAVFAEKLELGLDSLSTQEGIDVMCVLKVRGTPLANYISQSVTSSNDTTAILCTLPRNLFAVLRSDMY